MLFIPFASVDNDDANQISKLYESHKRLFRKTAYDIVLDNDAVEDIISEAIIKLIENFHKIHKKDYYKQLAYAINIIKNASYDHLRSKKRHNKRTYLFDYDEAVDNTEDDKKYSPEENLITSENTSNLSKAIGMLPEKYKVVLKLKYFLEMSDTEIGKQLGVKSTSVCQYTKRAKDMARKIMDDNGWGDDK